MSAGEGRESETSLIRMRVIREARDRGEPVDLDLAENIAGWCVFVGDQLSDTPWLVTAAAMIRAQANEIRTLRSAHLSRPPREEPAGERGREGAGVSEAGIAIVRLSREERVERALRAMTAPIPSTKGMGPKDRAQRLHAELMRRIAMADAALAVQQGDYGTLLPGAPDA